jgi:hypothetical protein
MAQGQSGNNNILVVPQARQALEKIKYEVAQEWAFKFLRTDTMAIGPHGIPARSVNTWSVVSPNRRAALCGNTLPH